MWSTNLRLEIDQSSYQGDQNNLSKIDAAIGEISLGNTLGPESSVDGDIVSFSGTGGKTIADSGVSAASVVVGPASVTDARVAVFDGTTGKLLKQGTQLAANLASGAASSTSANLVAFSGTTGKLLADSGVSPASFTLAPVAAPSTATSTGVAGTWAYDATHIYICIATDSWVRATTAAW